MKRNQKKYVGHRLAWTVCATTLAVGFGSAAWADQLQLTGTIRDFKRGDQSGGHPDFQTAGAQNKFGHVLNMVTMDLSSEGKPVYNPTRPSSKDTMVSATRFNQWYKDDPAVNASAPLTLTLDNGLGATKGGVYSYSTNKFFPIDGQFFGNQNLKDATGKSRNFHFTFELHTNFTYKPGQKFTFIGDDDVWVYVNKKRVIDIGGVHSAVTGAVLLFDGKAFVTKTHFVTGGDVKVVNSEMAATMASRWATLGMTGTCPIIANDKYIDLNLNAGFSDTMASFNGTGVTVKAVDDLTSAVLKFADGFTQTHGGLSGKSATLSGIGPHAGKTIAAVTIKSGTNTTGQTHTSNGGTSVNATLDFFFAERHTTESNFRIDTSMLLETVQPLTVSPLYD